VDGRDEPSHDHGAEESAREETITDAAPKPLPLSVDETAKYRSLPPFARAVERVLVCAITLLGAAWAFEMQHWLGLVVFKEQFLALLFTCALSATFVSIKSHRREPAGRVPWYDWILAVLGAVVGLYVAVLYGEIVYDVGRLVTERYILGAIAVVLVLEATRRSTGWSLVVVGVLFILYARFSHLFPGILNAPSTSWERLATYLYLDTNGLFGLPLDVTGTIVIAFILFGRTLYAVKGDQFLTDFAVAAMGRFRGGPAKVSVIASSLFGTVSGSAVSNVVMDGPLTIPMMKRAGYPGHMAAAIEAVASTGGQIMPPVMGITAFLIAEFLSISYAAVVAAAAIPAVLYYLALFMQIDLEAAKRGFVGVPRADIPSVVSVLLRGWVFTIPIGVLIWTLMIEEWQPGLSAMLTVVTVVVTGFLSRATRPTLGRLVGALEETGRTILDLFAITAVAGLVIGALQISGLSFNFSLTLISLSSGSAIALLLMTAAVCIVLGMGMPTGVIYVMLAVLVAPALGQMGIVPIAAHMFLFYFGMMSMLTPPVCLATFAAASIAQSNFWRTGWTGMRLSISAYLVPFVMVFQPEIVAEGTTLGIVLVTLKTTVGVIIVSFGMAGYLFAPLGPPMRVAFTVLGSLVMLIPFGTPWGLPVIAGALALSVALALRERRNGARVVAAR
jgi:TRAP transporter 4TM/12TM fusion protein